MKKYIFWLVVAFGMMLHAQSSPTNVQIGSAFKIGKSAESSYKHIKFPKANMIIKRGGIVDFKALVGKVVVVTAIDKNKNGTSIFKLKLKNGRRFFGSHPVITANIDQALKSGELQILTN